MSRTDDHIHEHASQRLAVRVTDNDFQRDVLDKLGRLEVKMDMLVGGAQPGSLRSISQCGHYHHNQCADHDA